MGVHKGPSSSRAAKKLGSIFCSSLLQGSGALGGEKSCWHLLLPQKHPEMLPCAGHSNLTLPSNLSFHRHLTAGKLIPGAGGACGRGTMLCLQSKAVRFPSFPRAIPGG